MMADKLLPKRSPDKYQRLVMIKDIYHVKYSVRNSLDKLKHIALVNIKGLSQTALINLNVFSNYIHYCCRNVAPIKIM